MVRKRSSREVEQSSEVISVRDGYWFNRVAQVNQGNNTTDDEAWAAWSRLFPWAKSKLLHSIP